MIATILLLGLLLGYLAGRLHGRAAHHAWAAAELYRLQEISEARGNTDDVLAPVWSAGDILLIFRGPKPPLFLGYWPRRSEDTRHHKIPERA